jgi:uncharacterized protein (TIGR02598 family)
MNLSPPDRSIGTGISTRIPKRTISRREGAFSLVEISLAIAIVAFAFVALLGLLPPGMNNFRMAMDVQTSTEIFQRVIADAQETDFDTLVSQTDSPDFNGIAVEVGGNAGQFFRLPWRYFDEQGQELKVQNPDLLTDAERASVIYAVHIRGSKPGAADPTQNKGNFTSLPGVHSPRFYPRDITILSVQVLASKGRDMNALLEPNRATTFLLAPSGLPERIYSSVVARNGYSKKKTP